LDEGFTRRLVLAEKDPKLREFWETSLNDPTFAPRVGEWTEEALSLPLAAQHKFTLSSLKKLEHSDKAFWIVLMSRTKFNGVFGGGFKINDVRGILTNWPSNLASSLERLYGLRDQIELLDDAFAALDHTDRSDSFGFIDPPYTWGPHSPGRSMYDEWRLDHNALVARLAAWKGRWQLTYDVCLETLKPLTKVTRAEVTVLSDESGQVVSQFTKEIDTSEGILFRQAGVTWKFVSMLSGGRGTTRKKAELVVEKR
jgi:hypothetical protein